MIKQKKILLLSLGLSLILGACQSEEEKEAVSYKADTKILNTYSEDIAKPVIIKEKTSEEVIEDLVKKELGYTKNDSYKKVGFSDINSISSITQTILEENTGIPKTPSLSKNQIAYINKSSDVVEEADYQRDLVKQFELLEKSDTKLTDEERQVKYEEELKVKYEEELKEAEENVGKELDKDETYEGNLE